MTKLAEIAAANDRDYITPEDVQDAINAGADRLELYVELLNIIGKQSGLGVEDVGLACFIAAKFDVEDSRACDVCDAPADGPGDAQRVNCDCGTVVCSACCEARDGESYCPTCAKGCP